MSFAGKKVSRRAVLGGLGALAGHSLLSGCGSGGSTTSSGGSSLATQPTPSGPMTTGSVTVGASSGFSIGAGFAGLSYEKAALSSEPLFTGSNTNLIGLFNRLGPSLLRIGGNSVDQIVWNPTGAGQTAGQVGPPDVDGLAAFLQATGWKALYGINLGGSAPGSTTNATTTTLAAEEVAYAVSKLGSSLYGIEIGNEPDLYGGNPGNYYPGTGNWSLSKFETLWEQYRTAILASSPNVVLTGPADASNATTWTVPFGQHVDATQEQIALLTQHYYRGNGQSPSSTAANLITPDTGLPPVCAAVLAGARSIGIPWRMGETNSYYNGGSSGVSDTYASSLWVIDHMATIALNGAAGVNMHGGGGSTGYALTGDNSYTPIDDNNGVVVEARPEYYGMLMFNMLGEGVMRTTAVSAGGLNVTAYTVVTSSGGLNILIVNKDQTQNVQASVVCGQAVNSASLLEMTGPDLTATSGVMIQGATVGIDGSFAPGAAYAAPQISGETVSCYVPALSAVLVRVS